MAEKRIIGWFPNLSSSGFKITSPIDISYNCIAWAAGENDRWWWPDSQFTMYWPPSIPRESTIDAFKRAYGLLGYKECSDGELEKDFEKIAIYADSNGNPKHAAKQLESGHWTSKLGRAEDIEHFSVNGVSGNDYGSPVLFMKRPKKSSHS